MSEKTLQIIKWVLAGLCGLLFAFSAFGKLTANEQTLQMAASWGIDAGVVKILGVIELLSAILFLIPRTGVLGTLLLAAYMGGAIATHMQHNQPVIAPIVISAFVWLVAAFRFPELTSRILNKG
jgi:hypothetical protein